MSEGTCKRLNINPILFFPEQGCQPDIIAFAQRVCSICPVQDECLTYADDNNIRDGIWGGLTRNQREKARRLRIMLSNPRLDESA
jgi:WhiB family redox-sensing transcriptional regulator